MSVISTPEQALQKLKQGNAQYIKNSANGADISVDLRKDTAVNGQKPYAVVITCSDSRVPPEHIFSAGIGELFVVRTAGNVISDFDLGSIEYGVSSLGAKLILVMGHSKCGAIAASMGGTAKGGFLQTILDEIKPAIKDAKDICEAEKLNIEHSKKQIFKSAIIKELIEQNKVSISLAKYEIETGAVDFFE